MKATMPMLAAALALAGCTQESQNQIKRDIQNWTGTNGVLEVYAGDKVVKRFLKIDKLSTALIIDPMLATAGSMIATVDLLKRRGCKDIRALVLVAAPEGIAALDKAHPDVRCWTAAIDSHLNEVGYIIPGLGDAGDKIFGTKEA